MMAPDLDNPTRHKLLDAAEQLMLSRGFGSASVDGICSAAGVTKGSFFHYFRSKVELAKVVLERFGKAQEARFRAACEGISDPLERVFAIIDLASERGTEADHKGCLLGTLAQEVSETHPEIRDVCRCGFEGFAEQMGALLAAAKEQRCPDADFDPQALGPYLLAVIQGSLLLLKTVGDSQLVGSNLRQARRHLENLYGV